MIRTTEVLVDEHADLLRDREQLTYLRQLLTRALEAIPSRPCCAEVPRCWCPVGALRHELRLAADGAPAGAEAEPAGEHARRVAR